MVNVCTAVDMGLSEQCICCGGSLYSGGYFNEAHEWVYVRDPFAPYVGSAPSLRYCSPECLQDWESFLSDQAEKRRLRREFEDWENDLYANAWDGKS